MITNPDYSGDSQSENNNSASNSKENLFFEFDFDNNKFVETNNILPRTKNLKDWYNTSSKVIASVCGTVLSLLFCFGVSNTENLHYIGASSLTPSFPKSILKTANTAKVTKVEDEKTITLEEAICEEEASLEVAEVVETATTNVKVVETINGLVPLKDLTSDSFKMVSKKAQAKGSKVLLKFGAKWCLPCKIMEETVFQSPEVKAKIDKEYETLYVDIDSFDGINLKQNFGIYSLPTYVILDKDRNLLGHYSGAKTVTEVQNMLSY